jgi:putative DNA primase/helicase
MTNHVKVGSFASDENATDTSTTNNNVLPTLNFAILNTKSTKQCKIISLNHGALVKESIANAYDGHFEACQVHTLSDFEQVLTALTAVQSLILATPHRQDGTALQAGEKIGLTTKDKPTINRIPRSKDFIQYRNQAGFLLFDIDSGGTYEQLLEFIPELIGVGALIRPSSSSFIYDADGNELAGAKGWHIFIPVLNVEDSLRIASILWARQWLAGYGHYLLSNGLIPQTLERGIFDKAVLGACERLAFEAKPILNNGLIQLHDKTRIIEGQCLDTSMITELSADELEQVEQLKQQAKEAIKPDHQRAIKSAKRGYIAQSGKPARVALADFKQFQNKELIVDFILYTVNGTRLAGDLTAKDDGLTMCDPFEPDYDGGSKTKAKFFWNNGNPIINSQAHGGIKYRIIERDYQGVTSLENALRRLFEVDFSPKEVIQKIKAAKVKLGLQSYADIPEHRLSIYQYWQAEKERQDHINNLPPSQTADDSQNNDGIADVPHTYPNADERPCYRVYDDWWIDLEGNKKPSGTYCHIVKQDKLTGAVYLIDKQIAGVLRVIGLAYATDHKAYGMVLQFKNRAGFVHNWNMPMYLLAGGTNTELIKELLEKGLYIVNKCQNAVLEYINSQHPKKHVYTANQVGWFEDKPLFVLPYETIGNEADSVMFQSVNANHAEYAIKGTVQEWRDCIGALCVNNPLLMLSIASAFTGALLKFSGMDGAGLHYIGGSSCGKTTIIKASCSAWGHHQKYKRTWKSTANGLEGACVLFNDCLLVLDEIGDSEANELKQTIYALGNGTGKQRANASGNARNVKTWRVIVLSNGEKSIESHLAEKGYTAKAGQLMRLLQIPVFGKYGAFNDLHGFSDGASFANELNNRVNHYYGAVGHEFLEKLTRDTNTLNDLPNRLELVLNEFALVFGNLCEQESRAAKTFALIGIAGELATEYGLTGWSAGMALDNALICYEQWRNHRGTGNTEQRQIIELVSNYVETFGDARFTRNDDTTRLNNIRSGYWRESDNNGKEWLFTKAGLQEATKGHDFNQVLSVLKNAGALLLDSQGKSTRTAKIAGIVSRFYIITINDDSTGNTSNTFENSGVTATELDIPSSNTGNISNTSKTDNIVNFQNRKTFSSNDENVEVF